MIRRLGLTEGQTYTAVIGLVLAVVLAVAGIPAVLRDRPLVASALDQLNPRGEPPVGGTPTPTTTSSAAIPAVPGVVATPKRVAVTGAPSPALPPGISGGPATAPPPLTITTFARVDHPGAPGGLAAGPDGTIYVPTDNGSARGDAGASHVFSYDPGGNRSGDIVINGQASNHVNGLVGAAVDPGTGSVTVLEPDDARIIGVDVKSGSQHLLAQVPDLPACLISLGANPCQQGAQDRKPFPVAASYDQQGDLFVTDPAQDTIWRLRSGDHVPQVWFQSTYFAVGDGPYGLAVGNGSVEVTVGTTVDPAAPTDGGLYRVAVNADGSAGPLTLVASFPRGDEPGPLAVGGSGTAYIVLRSTGAIVAIASGGSESWRITPPGEGPIPLDAPSALALVSGQLLVTNEGSGADATRWAVLAIVVNDGVGQ